jgi:hypothetical protein
MVETEATAMARSSPVQHRFGRHVEGEPEPHAVLDDAVVLDS